MKRKNRGILKIMIVVLLLALYLFRIQAVNRQNDKTEIHYVNDDETLKTDRFEITVQDEVLYETAAFVAKYPDAKDYYLMLKDIYASQNIMDALLDDKYILCVRVKVKNDSEQLQEIDYNGFDINAGVSYHNGMDPSLFGAANQFSGLSLKAGHDYSFWMPYHLNKQTMRKERYKSPETLAAQDFSIMFSGYPHIQHMRLSHVSPVRATSEEQTAFEELLGVAGDPGDNQAADVPDDTPEGTLIKTGGEYIQNGVKFTVESCHITKDFVEEMRKYESWEDTTPEEELKQGIRRGRMDKKGHLISDRYFKNSYAVFVTVHAKNLSGRVQTMGLQTHLCNYTGKTTVGTTLYSLGKGIGHDKNSFFHRFEKDADTTVTYLYYIQDQRHGKRAGKERKWFAKEKPLYLDFTYCPNGKGNLLEGNYSNSKYLQIK